MASGSIVQNVVDRPPVKAARPLQTRSARPYAGIPRGPGPARMGDIAQIPGCDDMPGSSFFVARIKVLYMAYSVPEDPSFLFQPSSFLFS